MGARRAVEALSLLAADGMPGRRIVEEALRQLQSVPTDAHAVNSCLRELSCLSLVKVDHSDGTGAVVSMHRLSQLFGRHCTDDAADHRRSAYRTVCSVLLRKFRQWHAGLRHDEFSTFFDLVPHAVSVAYHFVGDGVDNDVASDVLDMIFYMSLVIRDGLGQYFRSRQLAASPQDASTPSRGGCSGRRLGASF